MQSFWFAVTQLGSAGVILPCAGFALVSMLLGKQKHAALRWLLWLTAGAALVLASKLAFMGWGIGCAALNFTGFSGHAYLATSILPVLLAWSLGAGIPARRRYVVAAGLVLGGLVAYSRLPLGAHSTSEVLSGWMIGAVVSIMVSRHVGASASRKWELGASLVIIALAIVTAGSIGLPTHEWEKQFAMKVSGNPCPFTRADLYRPNGHRTPRCIPGMPSPVHATTG